MSQIEVITAGARTMVQDLGFSNAREQGVPAGGWTARLCALSMRCWAIRRKLRHLKWRWSRLRCARWKARCVWRLAERFKAWFAHQMALNAPSPPERNYHCHRPYADPERARARRHRPDWCGGRAGSAAGAGQPIDLSQGGFWR